MIFYLNDSIQTKEIFNEKNEAEQILENNISNDFQNLENDLKPEIDTTTEVNNNDFKNSELDEISIINYKEFQKDGTILNPENKIENEDEIRDEINNIFPEPKEPISKNNEEQEEKKEDKDRYGIDLDNQPIKHNQDVLNLDLKFFDESKTKEKFSDKYKTPPIFKQNRLKTKRKRKRKKMKDNMRKRIKSHFHKKIQNKLNDILKEINIEKSFNFPQLIVADVTRERNKNNFGITLEETLSNGVYNSKIFNKIIKRDKISKILFSKLYKRYKEIKQVELIQENNKEILKILNENKNEKLQFLLKKKMEVIYEEYLKSDEYEDSIKKLKKEGNYYAYIHDYTEAAQNLLAFVKKEKKTKRNKKKKLDN